MADTRRSPRAERRAEVVVDAVARALVEHAASDAATAVAISGGRDSVALLHAACEVARERIVAIHVHHGLSTHADEWTTFCEDLASTLGVPFLIRRVEVERSDPRGIEAAARDSRYAALREAAREVGASTILLAHHQDDQAETLLLQLGRGAGPHGLASMPRCRDENGIRWMRPLLEVPRAAIEAFVRGRGLAHIEDDSNVAIKHRRNALRHQLVRPLTQTFPGYPATFARAATLQAETSLLLDELAELDATDLIVDGALDRRGLAALSPPRARNLLRHFLRLHGLRAPSLARLTAMQRQLCAARPDSRVELVHEAAAIGVYRGRVFLHAQAPRHFEARWRGESLLALPHGALHFTPATGEGLAQAITQREIVVRPRNGGERLALAANRPRRALKAWLQEMGMPPWQRSALPLVYCDGELAVVPGLGTDIAFVAKPGAPGLRIEFRPTV
ncbi:MAG TPA: tRNA lysidine(34) synthetase TilS [Casimicrobiaceae bacterium]|nr:tRNA lysidine(34) synthetase TilS [Casimicrobiaceae bacterium]